MIIMPTKHPDRGELIAGLNEDLANEYASIIQYRTLASTVRGPHRLTLRPLFADEIPDELSHAELLGDAIVTLGGTPTTRPAPVEIADDPVSMLRQTVNAERQAIARYAERRTQAEALGEHGLAVDLDDVIADETRHRNEIQLVLDGWEEQARAPERTAERARHEPPRRRESPRTDRAMVAKSS
jgi:bacterioferritin